MVIARRLFSSVTSFRSISRPVGAALEIDVKINLMLAACCAVFLLGCPANTTPNSCTPQSCANGCCSADGVCKTDSSASACGLNGSSCSTCTTGQSCGDGVCRASSTGGGGGATGGGGGATGGGGGATGGAGGGDADAGVDCATTSLDPALGDLLLRNGATVTQSAALPAGITTVGLVGTTLYGVGTDKQLHRLGTLPTLTLGPALASVLSPADVAADAGAFLGGSLATSGTQLLTGYTKSGAGFPGSVLVYETADGGVRHLSAPGNYTAAGFASGFLVNGGSLDSASGAGVFVLDPQGAYGLATFDAAWMASSGYTGVTANGVFLLGYFDGSDFKNHVRAVTPSLSAPALTGRSSFALLGAAEVLAADDSLDFATVGDDAVVVRGGYDAVTFAAFTTRVERLPLTLSGSGTQTVTAGAPVTLLEATHRCTSVSFVVGSGAQVLVGLTDRNGRRVVLVHP